MFEKLRDRKVGIIDVDIDKEYAVYIPLIKNGSDYEVVFEVRSSQLNTQPGEICFPGGRREEGEQPDETALRETCEELLIDKNQLEIVAPLDILVSPFNFVIYPYLGVINDYTGGFNEQEVAAVFTVPLTYFFQQEPDIFYHSLIVNQTEKLPLKEITGSDHYSWRTGKYEVDVYNYQDRVIWGLTAKIMKSAVEILERES